jgi:transketolase
MLHEALLAAELLEERGTRVRIVAMPWLNRIDVDWLLAAAAGVPVIVVVDDHAPEGGLGDAVRRALADAGRDVPRVVAFGVEGWPVCGTPPEALRAHALDGASIADRVAGVLVGAVA